MKKETKNLLGESVSQLRERGGDNTRLDEMSNRAWQEIEARTGDAGSGCDRFSSLIPAYNSGALDEAQATLLHEHMRECYRPCRPGSPPRWQAAPPAGSRKINPGSRFREKRPCYSLDEMGFAGRRPGYHGPGSPVHVLGRDASPGISRCRNRQQPRRAALCPG